MGIGWHRKEGGELKKESDSRKLHVGGGGWRIYRVTICNECSLAPTLHNPPSDCVCEREI
jgi:hypothetical protein